MFKINCEKGCQTPGFLVGQVMKASRGQANPKRTNELIQEELKKR